jgi:hypothetical protein
MNKKLPKNAITFKLGSNEMKPNEMKPNEMKPTNLVLENYTISSPFPTSPTSTSNPTNFMLLIKDKIIYIQEIIQKTIISVSANRKTDLFSNSEYIICISTLNDLYEKTSIILDKIIISEAQDLLEQIISELQPIVDKISNIISTFGTESIVDLLFICFGTKYVTEQNMNEIQTDKFNIIKRFIKPIGYKSISWKSSHVKSDHSDLYCINKITENTIQNENYNHLECLDPEIQKNFTSKIHGIRIIIQNNIMRKTLVIHGLIEDLSLDSISNTYIKLRKTEFNTEIKKYTQFDQDIMERIINTFTIKDILITGTQDICKKMIVVMNEINTIKHAKLDETVSRFVKLDIYSQRNLLIQLLLYNKEDELHYIAYLLYDILSNTNNTVESLDSDEQRLIYNSFPWKIKLLFKDAMKNTVKYTQEMTTKYDINRISLEQQVFLMKAPHIVKEKAINKLKEIKGKADESCSKAKQYLEGLLKIPFETCKEEPILKEIDTINTNFSLILDKIKTIYPDKILVKSKYSNQEIFQYIRGFESWLESNFKSWIIPKINVKCSLTQITQIYNILNVNKLNIKFVKTKKIELIRNFIQTTQISIEKKITICDILSIFQIKLVDIYKNIVSIKTSITLIHTQLNTVVSVLDNSIYGHDTAKNQILKIIGQWVNGKQSGYCFGFEGSPGIGKTSLAKKGLANCLIDENGISRPFSFIALGGSCNGSTLEGHSYTYVNSTWGKIADILMDSKCMNPIIYIDELDKVSTTEHGKEIIGILTHLIDYTQNDDFQDKYFSGIPINLSKALIIFSYNDPEKIDSILLDRIHRIKFDNLTIEDKIVIVQDFILPEINEKMGFTNTIHMNESTIKYLIETYTLEPGVRKLKEIIFDLFGDINLELLKCNYESNNFTFPIELTIENITEKYLKKYLKVSDKKIHIEDTIGTINGLWANTMGKGGIIPIETVFFPTSSFLELRLTGLQGEVMKESMNVAKSLAWSLTPETVQIDWIKTTKDSQNQGIHVHCPDGAVSKDGPSAGTAITVAMYSLLNNKKINHTIGITGEIDLKGNVTAIGGLQCKFLGGIQAGIKTFIFPKANNSDYQEFKQKYIDNYPEKYEGIKYIQVSNIKEVLELIFV